MIDIEVDLGICAAVPALKSDGEFFTWITAQRKDTRP
jgi:hypothetical protein